MSLSLSLSLPLSLLLVIVGLLHCVCLSAGNYADELERLRCEGLVRPLSSPFHAKPRLGQYLVLDPSTIPGYTKGQLIITRPIQPLPNDTTKGIFIYSTLYGHIIVGPTSDESIIREGATPDPAIAAKLHEYALRVCHFACDCCDNFSVNVVYVLKWIERLSCDRRCQHSKKRRLWVSGWEFARQPSSETIKYRYLHVACCRSFWRLTVASACPFNRSPALLMRSG